MHELSLCKNILDIVKEKALEHQGKYIKTIYLELGELMAVEKTALLFSFPILAKNTIAEHAKLHILDIPGEGRCESCGLVNRVKQLFSVCENCGKFSLVILRGNELRVKAMEVL